MARLRRLGGTSRPRQRTGRPLRITLMPPARTTSRPHMMPRVTWSAGVRSPTPTTPRTSSRQSYPQTGEASMATRRAESASRGTTIPPAVPTGPRTSCGGRTTSLSGRTSSRAARGFGRRTGSGVTGLLSRQSTQVEPGSSTSTTWGRRDGSPTHREPWWRLTTTTPSARRCRARATARW
jgi:hypothetical protein